MTKKTIILLANEHVNTHQAWLKSLNIFAKDLYNIKVVNLTKNDWFEKCSTDNIVGFIAQPPGVTSIFKQLFDERLMIISKFSNNIVYPNIDEVLIYENKRYLSYYLKALNIPHPNTSVFYNKKEAEAFMRNTVFPIVAKINIGASGNGIRIIKTLDEGLSYINIAFEEGVASKTGPKLNKGSILLKIKKVIKDPTFLMKRLKLYKSISQDKQKGFVLFQEFISHSFEWRCVRIGDSFFAHKKNVVKGKASGTLDKGYETPPIKLMNFIKDISDKNNLQTVAIDVFENPNGKGYLVNEIQTVFGQSDTFQMKVDGVIGRYIYKNEWCFEEGDFNSNSSYDLKVKHFLNILNRK